MNSNRKDVFVSVTHCLSLSLRIHEFQDKEKKRERKKYITADPNLLLSFIYFDQNHCGYLIDKDAEEIMHCIGLSQSRAQVSSYSLSIPIWLKNCLPRR